MKKVFGPMIVLVALLVLCAACSPAQKVVVTLDEYFPYGEIRKENTMSNEYYYPAWVPSHTGYIFEGWFYDKDGTDKFEKTKVQKDLTLYGSWSVAPELLTVDCTIDTSSIELAAGDLIRSYAYYDETQSNPQITRVDDPSKTEWSAQFQVKSGASGTISTEVTRDGSEIGSGELEVEFYESGKAYTVVVSAAD